MKLLFALAVLGRLGAAHFKLTYPEPIGYEGKIEDQAPCGGFTPDFSKDLVDFHVGGDALAMRQGHQQANWLFRATTDQKAQSGWVQLFPIVSQTGLGDFCEPSVPAPESFVGKKGVVSVVSSAPDGLLYQCVAVNFVSGSADRPSACKNGTAAKASFTDDSKLSALVGNASTPTPSRSSDAAATSTGAAPALQPWAAPVMAGTHAVHLMALVALAGAYMAW